MRAVEQDALFDALHDVVFAGMVEFDADHEAVAAHLFDELVAGLEIAESGAEVLADAVDLREEFIEDIEEFEGDGRGEDVAAEGGAVHAGLDGRRGALVGEDDAHGQAAGEGFSGDHDIGLHFGRDEAVRPVLAGASDAALNGVEHEQGVVAVGQAAGRAEELGLHGVDAAFALDAFDDDAAGAFTEGRFEGGDVVGGDPARAGQQGFKVLAVLGLAGDGDGPDGTAVEGVIEGEDLGPVGSGVGAEDLDGAFHGLGAGVGEEDAVEAGDLAQALGQFAGVLVIVEIRGVEEQGGLLLNHLGDARVGVAEGVDADAAEQVEILAVIETVEVAALAASQRQRVTGVGGHHILTLQLHPLLRLCQFGYCIFSFNHSTIFSL